MEAEKNDMEENSSSAPATKDILQKSFKSSKYKGKWRVIEEITAWLCIVFYTFLFL